MNKFEKAVAKIVKRREAGVDRLVAEALASGKESSRLYHTILYDMEHAPHTTNKKQLALLGIKLPPSNKVSEEALPALLLEIANGLAQWGVFLIGDEHLSDRALYQRLLRASKEEVAEVPPSVGCSEFLDFGIDAPQEAEREDRSDLPQRGFPINPNASLTQTDVFVQ
jgi:hypothetical protein